MNIKARVRYICMPKRGFKTITVREDIKQLLDEMRARAGGNVSYSQILREILQKMNEKLERLEREKHE